MNSSAESGGSRIPNPYNARLEPPHHDYASSQNTVANPVSGRGVNDYHDNYVGDPNLQHVGTPGMHPNELGGHQNFDPTFKTPDSFHGRHVSALTGRGYAAPDSEQLKAEGQQLNARVRRGDNPLHMNGLNYPGVHSADYRKRLMHSNTRWSNAIGRDVRIHVKDGSVIPELMSADKIARGIGTGGSQASLSDEEFHRRFGQKKVDETRKLNLMQILAADDNPNNKTRGHAQMYLRSTGESPQGAYANANHY